MKSIQLSLLSSCFANMVYASDYAIEEKSVRRDKGYGDSGSSAREDISIATEAKRLHITRKASRM